VAGVAGVAGVGALGGVGAGGGGDGAAVKQQTLLEPPLQAPVTVEVLQDEGVPQMPALPLKHGIPASPGTFKQQTLLEPPLQAPVTVEVLHEEGVPQMPTLPFKQGCPASPTAATSMFSMSNTGKAITWVSANAHNRSLSRCMGTRNNR
jgi:hypothetical protein